MNIDFNEIFADTVFLEELNTVIFGAELTLDHLNISEAQKSEIRNKIIRSAFTSFKLDYNNMSAACQLTDSPITPKPDYFPQPDTKPMPEAPASSSIYSGLSSTYSADDSNFSDSNFSDSNFNRYQSPMTQPAVPEETPSMPDSYNASAYSFQPAASNDFETDTNESEQTVVYENFAAQEQRGNGTPEMSFGYGAHTEALWDSEDNKDDGSDLGKIRWTTFSSGVNPEDE